MRRTRPIKMRRTIPPRTLRKRHRKLRRTKSPRTLHIIFDEEWSALVRVEDLFRSGLGKTAVRELVEQARQRHYAACSSGPADGDPYWRPDGRMVHDWSQTLPQFGSVRATELYEAFVRWAVEWAEGFDEGEFSQTKFGRLLKRWYRWHRTSSGVTYHGVSLP